MSGGTYTLVFVLPEPTTIDVGALGPREFPAGGYAYTGSALGSGGFSRIDRHRRVAAGEHDARHWHIDYFAGESHTQLVDVAKTPGRDAECEIASMLDADTSPEAASPIEGFGCSDCNCRTHLSYRESIESMQTAVEHAHERVHESSDAPTE